MYFQRCLPAQLAYLQCIPFSLHSPKSNAVCMETTQARVCVLMCSSFAQTILCPSAFIIMCFASCSWCVRECILSNIWYSNLAEHFQASVAKATTSFISMCSAYVYHFILCLSEAVSCHCNSDFFPPF